MKTTVLLDHEPVADGGWLVRALLRIEGEAPIPASRVPLNLSLVLDRSGSMQGAKIAAAIEAASLLVRRLAPEDAASVVAFGSRVETVAEPATGEAQADLSRRIEGIGIEGCTNLSGGWLRARDFVAHGYREGSVNRVLLLTDGLANRGITEPEKLVGLCRTAAARGVTTTTIGFGADYDEKLLAAMAEAGGGNTYYIDRPDQAPAIFAEELEGLLSLSAQNVTVRIERAARVSSARVHHGYACRDEDGALALEVGDLYAREPRLVLAEFLLAPDEEADAGSEGRDGTEAAEKARDGTEVEVARIAVAAHVLTAGGGVERREVILPIRLSPLQGGRVEPEVRRELLLLEAAEARRGALEERARGEWGAASALLREAAGRIAEAPLTDADLREEADDLRQVAMLFDESRVTAADAKYLHQRAHDARVARRSASRHIARGKGGSGSA